MPDAKPVSESQQPPPRDSGFARFLTGRVTLMAENGKLTIPYPLVAVIASLVVVIAMQTLAGVWWASATTEKLNGMAAAQAEREAQRKEEVKRLESQIDEQRIWIQTTRERLVRLEIEKSSRR